MKRKNVVIKKEYHSRSSSRSVSVRDISGIYNACRCYNKENALLNKCVEDPRLQPSGMTPNLMGFTLIELLVVVLIIGILAAVAMPQYKFAIAKSRLATIQPLLASIKSAEEAYYLANGKYTFYPSQLDLEVSMWGSDNSTNGMIDEHFSINFNLHSLQITYCPNAGKNNSGYTYCCSNGEMIYTKYYKNTEKSGQSECYSYSALGKKLCSLLK